MIENLEPKPIVVEQAAAASYTLPAAHYTLSYLTGRWGGEWTLNSETIRQGARVLESRPWKLRGTRTIRGLRSAREK